MSKYDGATLAEIRGRVQTWQDRAEDAAQQSEKLGKMDPAPGARAAAYRQVLTLLDQLAEPCAFGDPLEPEHDHEACRDAVAADREPELDQIVDLGGPDGGRYWRVMTGEPADHPDARAAAVHARLTGSVGCTYNGVKVAAAPTNR